MNRIIIIICLLLFYKVNYAQQTLPYIQSSATSTFSCLKESSSNEILNASSGLRTHLLSLGNFEFEYNGSVYTDFYIHPNGWVSLGSDASEALENTNDLTNVETPVIAALYDEFVTDINLGAEYQIYYELQNITGDNVLVIEWHAMQWDPNVAVFNSGAKIDFQIRLYSNSKTIELLYNASESILFNYDPTAGVLIDNHGATIGLSDYNFTPKGFQMGQSNNSTHTIDALEQLNSTSIIFTPTFDDSSITVYTSQESLNVYPNETDRLLMHLNLIVPSNPVSVNLNKIKINLDMLSSKADILNLKLYSNNTDNFENSQLIATINDIESDSIQFDSINFNLIYSNNYFWITSDISGNAIEGNRIDIELLSIKVGDKIISSSQDPDGALLILNTPEYLGRGIVIPENEHYFDYTKNWSEEIIYDEEGNIVSQNRVYYDNFGRATQQHNNTGGTIITNQTVYDLYGRAAIKTLPALQTATEYIRYDDSFIDNSNNIEYSYLDFDVSSKKVAPNPLNSASTLANYYSNNNNLEPYVASSSYPYTRIFYNNEATSGLYTISNPGEAFRIDQGHLNFNLHMISSGELSYIYGLMRTYIHNINRITVLDQTAIDPCVAYKVINTNEKNEKLISFYGPNNILIAKCVSGMQNNTCATQKVSNVLISNVKDLSKHTNSIDIHLPKSKINTLKFNQTNSPIYGLSYFDINLFSVLTLKKLTLGVDYSISYSNGYFEISFLQGGECYDKDNFLRISLTRKSTIYNWDAIKVVEDLIVKFSYELDYSNWTANYYDSKLNLIATTQPKDLDCNINPINNYSNIKGEITKKITNVFGTDLAVIELPDESNNDRNLKFNIRAFPDVSNSIIMNRANEVNIPDLNAQSSFFDLQNNEIIDINEITGPCNFVAKETEVERNKFRIQLDIYGSNNTADVKLNTDRPFEIVFDFVPYEKVGCNIMLYKVVQVASDRKYMFDNYLLKGYTNLKYKIVGIYVNDMVYDPNNVEHNQFIHNNSVVANYFDLFKLRFDYEIEKYPHSIIHNNSTIYGNKFNIKNQLIETNSQDEGLVKYLYDKEGKLRFTQNAVQAISGKFFYTNYDKSGRVIETGEYNPSIFDENSSKYFFFQTQSQYTGATFIDKISVIDILDNIGSFNPIRCTNRHFIKYDEFSNDIPVSVSSSYSSKNLHNRVSKTWNDESSTWYSYNYRGELVWTIQSVNNFGTKTIDYKYDYFGKVTAVDYQNGQILERFKHSYVYDEYFRLAEVYTTKGDADSVLQAKYIYYKHGPLKRKELGETVQGIDFVYTVNGWLKSINDPTLTNRDPGKDGYTGNNSAFGKDVFGLSLDYYSNDYYRAGTNIQNNIHTGTNSENYYDGKIKAVRWQTQLPNAASNSYVNSQLAYCFQYDEFSQLKTATFGTVNAGNLESTIGVVLEQEFLAKPEYKVSNLTYDKNGNIQTLKRYGNINVSNYLMDQLTYNYYPNSNKLQYVKDEGPEVEYLESIPTNISTSPQYIYDELGRLVTDLQKNINIKYNLNGKVSEIYENSTQSLKIKFTYNERGQKIKKTIYPDNETNFYIYNTYYVNDLSGNVMAIYTSSHLSNVSPVIQIQEQTIVGLGRIGVHYTQANQTVYEITDHLGNVRATVSSVKTNGNPEVLSYTDFYPHGGILPERSYVSSNTYRYDYQGQEKDPETNWNNFELRMYDPNLARWMSPDPYGEFHSPYLAMGNNPVSIIDPDGGKSEKTGMGANSPEPEPNYTGRNVDPFDMVGPDGGGSGNSLSAQFSNESDYYEYVQFSKTAGSFDTDRAAIKKANENARKKEEKKFAETLSGFILPEIEVLDNKIINDYQFRLSVNFIQNNLDNLTTYSWNKLILNANITLDRNLNLYFEGVRVYMSTIGELKKRAAVTLPGIGIFVNPDDITNLDLLRHEFGHVLQFNRYGQFDFFVIMITSAYSAKYSPIHQKTWTETQANTLSYLYFNKPSNWNVELYKIDINYLKIISK